MHPAVLGPDPFRAEIVRLASGAYFQTHLDLGALPAAALFPEGIALFQLLVPITGISVLTVEVALVGYTLLILFRNVLEGLRAAPPEVREAARGWGRVAGGCAGMATW